MPGKNGTAIEIPVNLRAQVENLKQLKETLVKASNEAGKESTLGKQLQKQLQNVNSMLSDIDELMISPTIDEAGFKQVQGLFDKFFKETNKAFTNIDIASFEQIATPEQIARVKEYHEEIKKLAQEREHLEKHGSAERSDTYLTRTGKQDVLTRGKAQKGFDPTASLGKNAENLEKLANQQMQSIASLTEANTQLANEAVAAAAAFQTATQNVNNLKAQRDTLRKDELAATFYHQMGSFDTSVPANANLRRPNIDNIRTGLRKSFNAVATDGGEIITEARDTVASWLQTTFNNVSATEATQMVNQNITTLLEQVMEKIFGDNYRNLDVSYNTDHSALMGNMQQYVRSQAEQLNRAHGTTNALELTTQRQLMDTQVKQAQEIVAKAKTATDKANTKLTENQDALARLETTEANTRLLATELKELAVAAQNAALAANETAAALKKEEQAEYKESVVNPVKQTGAAGRVMSRATGASADEALGEAGGQLAAGRSTADEAKEFKEHMQQSLKHWMGAQQIVSIVKNGIRQAYQDIKNLDTAMTNIAVVTDMSISDLWGKINEYMSIAQQYGVTTQGVYEVSQLYYQQGLSTNEVMAATTETLKLARIAGMDYAEAADAMTVAIRSFKMEMSDAQQVTDVYSKVAAITASDSEELAIAMSKTASSAESVGSSFENTTAMLAVMVETTRESAQNLGSALKSIISRYGEMKVGLTVDSEGEEIDYNKVDTALKSVGISIKDAQGQFRDFDDVIFELSEKWDSLDKNTQRYIATIMAGNRQQSRFIALVDNWERLEEVSAAAADSADAGLLQYAKTLDSLDTKLNQLSNNFQAFYMSIFNGEFFKGLVDIVNNIVTSFSRMGPILGGLNLLKLINQIKLVGQLLINSFAGAINKIRGANKDWQNSFAGGWEGVGAKIAKKIADALIKTGPKTGQAYVESIQKGINGQQQQPKLASDNTELIAHNNATLSSLHNLTGLVGVQESIVNSTKGYHSKANYAFGESGAHKNNSYRTYASQILADPNASQIDRNWANKINQAYDEYIQAIKATEVTIEQQQKAGQKALEAIKKADAERKEEVQILTQKNEELKQQQAYIEAETRAAQAAARRNKIKQNIGRTAFTVGTLAQTAALGMDTSTMEGYDTQGWVKGLGGAATAAGQFLTGDILGGAVTAVTTVIDIWNHVANRAQVELENAKKAAEEANVERAQSKEEYKSLESYTKRLEELNETRFESNEAQEEWLALNNEMAEKYPELISYIDSEGNAIVDLSASYDKLATSREAALQSQRDYWAAQKEALQLESEYTNTSINKAEFYSRSSDPALTAAFMALAPDLQSSDNETWTVKENTDGTLSIQVTYTNEDGTISDITDEGIIALASPYLDHLNNNKKALASGSYEGDFEVQQAYNNAQKDSPWALDYNQLFFKNSIPQNSEEVFKWVFSGNAKYSDLISSGIDLQAVVDLMNTNEEFGNSLADNPLFDKTWNEDLNKYVYSVSKEGQQIANWQKNQIAYRKAVEGFISSTGNLVLQGTNSLETISEISGWEELALIDATSTYKGNWLDMTAEEAEKSYQEFAALLAEWYGGLSENYQKTFNNILNNMDSYSEQDLIKELNKIGLFEDDPIYEAMMLKYSESRVSTIERWAKIQSTKDPSKEFKSYDEFRKENATLTDEQAAQQYAMRYSYGGDALSTQELDSYINRHYQLAEQVAANSPLKRIFENQNTLLENALDLWQSGELSDEASRELYEIINAEDFGSVDWSKRVQEWEKKYGEDLDEGANIISESFFTYVDSVLDEVDSTLDSFEDIIEKQAKGFTFEEARDLLQRYQKLDGHANASFDDIFEVLEDGTIVLRDLSKVTSDFYAQQAKDMEEASAKAQTSINNIKASHGAEEYDIPIFTTDFEEDQLEQQLLAGGVDPTMVSNVMAAIANGTIKTWNDVIAFLTRTKEEVDAGIDYYNKQSARAIAESSFDTWTDQNYNKRNIEFGHTEKLTDYKDTWVNKIQAQQETALHDGNYDPIDLDQAWNDEIGYMIEHGAVITDSGEIIWTSAIGYVEYLHEHTDELADGMYETAKLEAEAYDKAQAEIRANNTVEASRNLIDAIRTGEDINKAIYDFTEAIIPEWATPEDRAAIYAAVANLDENASDEDIVKAIMAASNKAGVTVSEAEINAYLADSANERTKRFFELYGKWIEGTITETELITLKELEPPEGVIVDFNQQAENTVQAYYQMLSNAIKTGDEELIQTAREGISSSAQADIEKFAEQSARNDSELASGGEGITEYDFDTLSLANKISSSNGGYSIADLSSLAGQTGVFHSEAFLKYFSWDNKTQQYIMKEGVDTAKALAEIYGDDIPSYVLDAFNTSEQQKVISDAITKDETLVSLPQTLSQAIVDPLSASLKDLIGLWETLLGRPLTEKEFEELNAARQAAINGDTTLLEGMLRQWVGLANQSGYLLDEEVLGNAAFEKWSDKNVIPENEIETIGALSDYGNIWTKKYRDKYDTTGLSQHAWDTIFAREQYLMEQAGARIDEFGNVIWDKEEDLIAYLIKYENYTEEAARELVIKARQNDRLALEDKQNKLQETSEEFVNELINTGKVAEATLTEFVQAIAPDKDAATQEEIRKDILAAMQRGESPEKIIENIASTYGVKIDQGAINAVAADTLAKRTQLFFELYEKWLAGTITEEELLQFEQLQSLTGIKVNLDETTEKTIADYYTMLDKAIATNNEEIIKSARDAAKEATVKELNQIAAGKDESGKDNDVETFQLAGQIDGANGKYSTDMLATLGAETGEFNKEAFQQYFHWDEESQSWLLDAGENMQDALVAIYGEEVPTYIIEAFEASELEERIAKEIEDDNNLTSIPEKFVSLISDPLNATLDELVKFWESLLGRELTANEFELVKEARSAAIAGDSEKLHGMLLGWMDYAKAETGMGYDVRWDSIKQASFGTNAQNQANIEKWLKGEGTIDDFEKVWMAEAGKLEGDDLVTFIQNKISSMRGAFIDSAGNLIITDYEEFMSYLAQEGLVDESILTQYAAEIQDTTLETIKSIFDYINKAIKGTLTATELRNMGKTVVSSGTMSADEWHTFASQNVSRVGTGYKMNEAAAFALQVNTGNYDFEGLVDQFDSIEEVNEMLEELQKNSEEWGDEFVRAAERVLESIKMIKAQDPSDAMFNWMDQDMEGWAGTYESTMGSIGKANDVINASMESGTMGLNDFYNMSHIVASQLEGEQLAAWNKYRDAVYATATTVDGGTVSLTNSQMTMEKALGIMGKSTESYYQDIAKQQIEFIDKQIAALEAQKKVEEALSAPGGNEEGARANLTRDDFIFSANDYTQKKNADGTLAFDSNGKPIMVLKDTATGIYSADEYGRAEAQWYEDRWGENGADAAARDKGQSFAAVMDEHFTSAYRDALKAGLDVTDAQVQRQIKDSAMARAGISGYYDTLTDENLAVLTTISEDVATIRKNTAPDNTTQVSPPPGPVYTTITEEDVLTEFNKAVELYDRDNTIITGQGQIDPQSIGDINSYMTKVFGNLDWQTILASSNATVGNSTFTGSQIYAMNFAPHPIPVDITIADTTDEAQEEAQATAETFQATLNDNPVHIHVGGDTTGAWTAAKRIISKVNALTAAVKVNLDIEPATVQVTTNGGVDTVTFTSPDTNATGNINGLAFATGTEKLIAGAHLANKSLVGELGPELAVYDGQYHLLGANGAEFANIPNDAIIFNHKQTEGILKGQANIRGRVKDGGKAFAEGNISGPAYDTGNIDAAIAALKEARAMWQSLLDRGLRELAGIGSNKGGGGSGNMAKAYSTELQEWYNLLRQIADIEAEINQLVAERTNLQNEYNGEAVARNLRQQQMLLNQQLKTQETLLVYQNAQLKRQAKQINNDKILSQFIEVNEDGIVQYLKGNEAFGGKGTLEVLSQLTDASAKEQLAFIKQIGFDETEEAYDQDGNPLEGEDLIQAFFDYFDTAINEYDGLQDTVNESTTKLEDIKSNITNINNEIRDNQMELEQNVFDTIVDVWEANIDALEEQKELIEEANDAYVEGLNEALQAERDMYDEQNAIADREQLQRQLSLLRRSGGSASEIADLEAQLDDALKDEYFRTQEDMIKGIEDANKAQIELLEKQITIQEDALEFQKENGVIWQRVAEVLSGTKESIMDFFMNGAGEGFFSKSKEQQIDALNEWSYSVGMYKEDQLMKSQAADFANGIVGENANGEGGAKVWETDQLKGHKSLYDELDDSQKQVVHDAYGTAYQQAIGEGKSQDEARAAGYTAVAKQMEDYQAERDAIKNTKNNDDNPNPDKIYDKEDNTGEFAVVRYSSNGNGTTTHANGKTEVTLYAGNTIKPTLTANSGSKVTHWTLNGKEMTVGKAYTLTTEDVSSAGKRINVVGHFGKIYNGIRITTQDGTEMLRDDKVKTIWEAKKKHKTQYPEGEGYQYLGYSQGGLVDYTGPALVHGTKSKPEAFLNAEQTALISEAVQSFSTTGSLTQMRETLASMASSIKGVVSSVATTSNNNSITIAPNAIAIHVDELADSYDVESLSNDIMNRITSIASKAGSRGINRR